MKKNYASICIFIYLKTRFKNSFFAFTGYFLHINFIKTLNAYFFKLSQLLLLDFHLEKEMYIYTYMEQEIPILV